MSSAVKLILGFSILATSVGCGGSTDSGPTGPQVVGGSGNTPGGTTGVGGSVLPPGAGAPNGTGGTTVGAGGTSSGAGGPPMSTGGLAEGIGLTPTDGWVDVMSNMLGVQGAVFMYGDPTTLAAGMPGAMVGDFTGSKACIKGTAAKVDMMSPICVSKMFTPPATDCFGEYWGAAIGMNLNQPIDMTKVPPVGGDPMPFNASAIKGFAFTISGAVVPTQIRFKVEDAAGEYCNTAKLPVKLGANLFQLSDLIKACYSPMVGAPTGEMAKSGLLKIAWQVYTVTSAAIPFDFCVGDIRATM